MNDFIAPQVRAVAFGDSITHNNTNGVLGCEFWPTATQNMLRNIYGLENTHFRNLGASGNTSTQCLNRIHSAFQWRDGGTEEHPILNVPEIAFVMIGVNDPGNSITTATTQANIEAIIRCLLNRVDGVVSAEGSLPTADQAQTLIKIGTRYWVVADGSTTGGLADAAIPTSYGQPARVAGSIASVKPSGATTNGAVWIKRRHAAGAAGWARIADDYTRGVKQVVIMSTQFLPTETPGSPDSANATLRTAQQAAVTVSQAISGIGSTKAKFLNHWQLFADDVTAGYIADMNALVYTSGNQHYNAEGHRQIGVRVADWLKTNAVPGVTAQSNWVDYWAAN
jgi:lysophospholipase L1-like esterase